MEGEVYLLEVLEVPEVSMLEVVEVELSFGVLKYPFRHRKAVGLQILRSRISISTSKFGCGKITINRLQWLHHREQVCTDSHPQ